MLDIITLEAIGCDLWSIFIFKEFVILYILWQLETKWEPKL